MKEHWRTLREEEGALRDWAICVCCLWFTEGRLLLAQRLGNRSLSFLMTALQKDGSQVPKKHIPRLQEAYTSKEQKKNLRLQLFYSTGSQERELIVRGHERNNKRKVKVKVAHSCLTLCDPIDHSSWNSPGQNTGVGRLSLLQEIFPTQGSNPGLPHCRRILYHLSRKGSPRVLEWVGHLCQNTQTIEAKSKIRCPEKDLMNVNMLTVIVVFSCISKTALGK